jgi:hypothetical protein
MQRVFDAHGIKNIGTDLPTDFLKMGAATAWDIVTNPPYKLAEEFVRHALDVTKTHKRKVAMVLRNEWDCGVKRRDLFADHPAVRDEDRPDAARVGSRKRPGTRAPGTITRSTFGTG